MDRSYGTLFAVHMTEAFASAVTVTVPILALAAGAEARAVRDRLRRPDNEWEKQFEAHQASHEFDPAKPPSEVLQYFKDVPGVSKAYVAERMLAVASAIVWLVVFVLLAITELLSLVWLALPVRAGGGLPERDLLPDGLKKAVAPKLVGTEGRGFVKVLLSELEGALERAADKAEGAKEQTPGAPEDGEPPAPA